MIKMLEYYESVGLNPYRNLSIEEFLLDRVKEDEIIMYLWRNERTVVVGRNQNIWNECNVSSIRESGGYLARRLSGGGAVYHDAGNLNFTFLSSKDNYSVSRQCDVITLAMRSLDLDAVKNGRNDICIDGRKFSGNAFYENGNKCFHHGTILIDTKVEEMKKFLNVPVEKLQSKSVESVRSRVVNLKELKPDITLDVVKKALLKSFGDVYGIMPRVIGQEKIDITEIDRLSERFMSEEWLYNKAATFSCSVKGRCEWGGIEMMFDVRNGRVLRLVLYTDALLTSVFDRIRNLLQGCAYMPDEIEVTLQKAAQNAEERRITEDIAGIIKKQLFD